VPAKGQQDSSAITEGTQHVVEKVLYFIWHRSRFSAPSSCQKLVQEVLLSV
jgi:hypothetical protein